MKTLRTNILIAAAISAIALASGCTKRAPAPVGVASPAPADTAAPAPAGSASPVPIKPILDHYLTIQTTLAGDSLDNVPQNAAAIATAARADKSAQLDPQIAASADAIAKAKDLGNAREDFKALSALLIQYLAAHPVESNTYTEVYCPMADATWLQKGEDVKNPYFGETMPGCGIVKRTF